MATGPQLYLLLGHYFDPTLLATRRCARTEPEVLAPGASFQPVRPKVDIFKTFRFWTAKRNTATATATMYRLKRAKRYARRAVGH